MYANAVRATGTRFSMSAIRPRRRKWHSLKAKGKREAQIECATLINAITAEVVSGWGGIGRKADAKFWLSPCQVEHKSLEHSVKKEHR